uniref:Uncharacterized protein n=1 Tax=Rhizophora mucronata TaxID=61149 RepID=A0A2P2P7Z9_RHIMU
MKSHPFKQIFTITVNGEDAY